jgi:hypothetical protein
MFASFSLSRSASILLAASLVSLTPSIARADGEVDVDETPRDPSVDGHRIDRTWLYLDDATIAAPLTAIGMSNVSYTSVGSSASRIYSPRQFAGNTAQPGELVSLGAEVGLLRRLSVFATGQMGLGGEAAAPSAGVVAGARFQLLPPSMQRTHLVASVGYLREAWAAPVYNDETAIWTPARPHGDNGAWVQAAFSQDIQRVRLGATIHAEHVFSEGRDPLDVMIQAGASFRIAGEVRTGVEYVGQDLEEAAAPGAEGGARHFLGPTASVQLLENRLTIVAGPSMGLSGSSPAFLGRVAAAYCF